MIRCSHGRTTFCSYVLDQMALHVYLQKVICGKNETSLVHVRFLSGIGSGSIAIFKHKNVHTMHFLFVFKLLFKKKGRGNFWRPQFALWRPKIYTWSPVGAHIKKLISDPGEPVRRLPLGTPGTMISFMCPKYEERRLADYESRCLSKRD